VGLVLAASVAVNAQYRTGQARPQSAAPRPGPPRAPAGEAPFRNTATFRPRPISPSLGIPIRGRGVPVFPLVWGWGAMPFYYAPESASFTLEEGPTGGVQLDVQPWRAAVFVDGVYAGRVDDFRGYYKHLELVAGFLEPEDGGLFLVLVIVLVLRFHLHLSTKENENDYEERE
jgi:hypothetical protein